MLYLLSLFSDVMCIHYAFYLLAPAVLVLFFRVLVFPCCVVDIRNNDRHYGDHENREKMNIFEHIRNILYL
jgi:hypothetical protein